MSSFLHATASNHVDFLKRLIDFVTTDTGLVADGENWTVLRKAGTRDISASSFLVNWEPWAAFKGTYGEHANGWSTALGQQTNCWIQWDMFEPLSIRRLKLKGPASLMQAPRDFSLDYWNGSSWVVAQAWTGEMWTANQIREFSIPAVGAKSRWRIFVSQNNGDISHTTLQDIQFPVFQNSLDYDYARAACVWLKAPGLTGLDPVYSVFQIYDRPTNDIYNMAFAITTGYLGDNDIQNQPGWGVTVALPMWNQPMPFWMVANGQRVTGVVYVDNKYMPFYVGKILPFGTPLQYPYPVVVAAPLPGPTATKFTGANTNPFKGDSPTMKLRNNAGTWVNPSSHPYSNPTVYRDSGGEYAVLPVTLYTTIPIDTYGVLDDIFHVSGFANSAENVVEVGAERYLCVPSPAGPGLSDYYAIRTA